MWVVLLHCVNLSVMTSNSPSTVVVREDGIYEFDRTSSILEEENWNDEGDDMKEDKKPKKKKKDYSDEMSDAMFELNLLKANQVTARRVVNEYSLDDLVDIFRTYGEERYSKRIAKAICAERAVQPIETTFDLVDVIKSSVPVKYLYGKIHPATRVFQALRIHVNQEFSQIEEGLAGAIPLLKPGGTLVAISFHGLEDVVVKKAMFELCYPERMKRKRNKPVSRFDIDFLVQQRDFAATKLKEFSNKSTSSTKEPAQDAKITVDHYPETPYVMLTGKKAQTPSREEVAGNPRSRSALLSCHAKSCVVYV